MGRTGLHALPRRRRRRRPRRLHALIQRLSAPRTPRPDRLRFLPKKPPTMTTFDHRSYSIIRCPRRGSPCQRLIARRRIAPVRVALATPRGPFQVARLSTPRGEMAFLGSTPFTGGGSSVDTI